MFYPFQGSGSSGCGHKGSNLTSSNELNRVKCRSCCNTDAYKNARKDQRNASRIPSNQIRSWHYKLAFRVE